MVKVSIIVPTYNVEAYLDECLESIQRQTLKEIEVICVNDGSTDHSLEIIRKYAEGDPRFVVIDKENGGYGLGMNVGLDKATGEYVGIVEPDDFVPLSMYEDLYLAAKENELDFVKADFYRFTRNPDNGNMALTYNHLDKTGEYYNKVYNPSEMPLLSRFIMNTWSGIYRRAFLEKYHIRHNETPGASFQDNGFFWQTFMYAKRAMFLDKPYYMNRRDNPNSSVNNKEKVYCMNIEYDHIRELFMQKGNEELWERFKGYYNLKRLHNYMFTLKRIADEYKKEYVQRISAEFRRAKQKEELDFSIMTVVEQEKLAFLIKDPEGYYVKYVLEEHDRKMDRLEKKNAKLEKEVEGLRNSTTMKVGKMIMYLPIKLKKVLKSVLK